MYTFFKVFMIGQHFMTDSAVSALSFPPGRQLSVFQIFHILKTGGLEKKINAWGDLKIPATDIYFGGLTLFCQKRLC